jgi:hypothetical protein
LFFVRGFVLSPPPKPPYALLRFGFDEKTCPYEGAAEGLPLSSLLRCPQTATFSADFHPIFRLLV